MGELIKLRFYSPEKATVGLMMLTWKNGGKTRQLSGGRIATINFPERPRPQWEKTA